MRVEAVLAEITREIGLAVQSGDITAVDGVKGMYERKDQLEKQLSGEIRSQKPVDAVVDNALIKVGVKP